MAKKSIADEKAIKSNKLAVTASVKHTANPEQTKSIASRNPASRPEQDDKSRTENPKCEDNNYVVSGQVTYPDNAPAIGVDVAVINLDSASEEKFGTARTDANGRYSITFTVAQNKCAPAEKSGPVGSSGPNFFVRVFAQTGEQIGQSDPVKNAGRTTTVNIVVSSGQYLVSGQVTYPDNTPAIGVEVAVINLNAAYEDKFGTARTDANGQYSVTFTYPQISPLVNPQVKSPATGKSGPNFLIRVYDQIGAQIGQSEQVNNAGRTTTLNFVVNTGQYRVYGTVQDRYGKPVKQFSVQAFDRDLRKTQPLGSATTDANGAYRINYELADFQLADVPSHRTPWLIVEVRETPAGEILARQEIQKADAIQYVGFTLTNGAGKESESEWQLVGEAVAPLLKEQGAASDDMEDNTPGDLLPWDLTQADVDFIVQDAALDRAALEAWVASSKICQDALNRLTEEHAPQQAIVRNNGWPFFYGPLRQGLASDLDGVLRASSSNIQRAWLAARAANRVPELVAKQLQLMMDVLDLLQRIQQLNPVSDVENPFAYILADNPLPTAVALDALAIFSEQGLNNPEAFLALATNHPKADAKIKTFVRSVRVHQLVEGHEGLSQLLNSRLTGVSDSIAPLAALPSSQWVNIAAEASVSPGRVLKMQTRVENSHALTALQARVNSGLIQLPDVSSGELAELLKNQGETVDSILRGSTPVKDRADEEAPVAHKVLRNLGRFVRVGVSMESAGCLMNYGIDSPAVAVQQGRNAISSKLGYVLPQQAAVEVTNAFFDVVEPVLNGANGFMVDVAVGLAPPPFMRGNTSALFSNVIKENLPTLAGLFGDQDACICKPCESMLSQPAYLVDLLNLLRKCWTTNSDAPTAYDLLGRRRDDIFTLKLSCENAETEIQHIDIVLEILERAALDTTYQQTASAIFPWSLPFDLAYAKTKAYLSKLGVSRLDLLSLRKVTVDKQLAAETIGLTVPQSTANGAISEWELHTHSRSGVELWRAYGFAPYGDEEDHVSCVDPASGALYENVTIQSVLIRGSILLDRTGLEMDALEKVLATKFIGEKTLNNREQCKTSEMRLDVVDSELESCLDRIRRFVRLHAKLPDWSIEQLDSAIVACDGLESSTSTDDDRESLVVQLASINRICEKHALDLDLLLGMPGKVDWLRQTMGLTVQQFTMLKLITGLDPAASTVSWDVLGRFCSAAERINESGLSIEQMAEAVLPKSELAILGMANFPAVKTTEQIEVLLKSIQENLRAVVTVRSDATSESQAAEALTAIFGATISDKLVDAIRIAGAEDLAIRAEPDQSIFVILQGEPHATHSLGEWLPLLTTDQTTEILSVKPNGNYSASKRFELLLEGVAIRRREYVLISTIAGQCGQPEADVRLLLSSRLLLDGTQTDDSMEFLDKDFWDGEDPPGVSPTNVPNLHAWMDRLYRLTSLGAALGLDSELMQLADQVTVGSETGINWRDMLAAGGAWSSPDLQALLDMLWLQRAEQMSRTALRVLLADLAARSNQSQPVLAETLRPLATRLGIDEAQTLVIAQQATANTAINLRNPTQLRCAFELLLLARHLGADGAQLDALANLADNELSAPTALALLQARVGEQAWVGVSQTIDDKLRQLRRDALVALLVHREEFGDVDKLYEHYLIDPLVESCLITTWVLEAITATQLFIQRILFGLEQDVSASDEIKQCWTWMRNYRVWEANRKVFLFPENWLYPELRDDKSTSFKQLESTLGQGELTKEVANQSFGQFLDDVAQMGQIQVLGMYEDVKTVDIGDVTEIDIAPKKTPPLIVRRKLYVVGRTPNPPYAYFWRSCDDFGTRYMEWKPWQRIELDIQGDHVMPFVLGGSLYVAWPIIRRIKIDANDANDKWEVKLSWSRYDGKSWRKACVSRDFWSDYVADFSDERRGFAFRCETAQNGSAATISAYALSGYETTDGNQGESRVPSGDLWGQETHPETAADINNAFYFLSRLILDSYGEDSIPPVVFEVDKYPADCPDDGMLPCDIKRQLFLFCYVKNNQGRSDDGGRHGASDGLLIEDYGLYNGQLGGRRLLFSYPAFSEEKYTTYIGFKYPATTQGQWNTRIPDSAYLKDKVVHFIWEFWGDADRNVNKDINGSGGIRNTQYFNAFYNTLKNISSRRIVYCHARIKLTAPDSIDTISHLPLDGTEGSYLCVIDSVQVPLVPGGFTELPWKLGNQPAVDPNYCKLTLTLEEVTATGTNTITLHSSARLAEIEAGYVTTQHLYFEFDGSKYNAREIGLDLDSTKKLVLVSEFQLTRDDSVDVLKRSATDLNIWVKDSTPWINGYRERLLRFDQSSIKSLKLLSLHNTEITVFEESKPPLFLAIGSASSQPLSSLPRTWHYSENELACYIDLSGSTNSSTRDLFVYPDTYKEATDRRAYWSEFQTIGDMVLQNSFFSADELPAIGASLVGAEWNKAISGELAFDARMPYASYNWEVFFHAPLLIADQLSKQHKFEDAEQWLRYVFDPTSGGSGDDAKRFLKFRVFKELDLSKQVVDDLTALAQSAAGIATGADIAAIEKLIQRWRDTPFSPFVVARRRHIAFLWRTLFAYLDNLIAWADSLYRSDTRESINEATMLYVLAQRILGRRPQQHAGNSKRTAVSYEELAGKWDDFANFWIDMGPRGDVPNSDTTQAASAGNQPSPNGMLYFCMPHNDKIDGYWNIVEDRLFNVRHCRNIEGITRTLPLTDAPIDPELLVRATAAGLNLSDVISGLYAPPPHYRYSILSARAAELTSEAKALGAVMLSAIEKRDAEQLAQLRSSNEIALLNLISEVRKLQINEAENNLDALRGTRKTVSTRYSQYQRLLGKKDVKVPGEQESVGEDSMLGNIDSGLASKHSNWGLIKEEDEQYAGFEGASTWSMAAGIAKTTGGGFHAAAALLAPLPGDTVTNASKVPNFLGQASTALGEAFSTVSQGWRGYAEQQGMMAGHLRRRDEWAFQSNQALREMQQIDKQILANEIRIQITRRELDNQVVQTEQAKAVDEVMRSKFSNDQLYQWMISQLSGLYFNAYRMALDMARRAERAAARELGVSPLNILRNDYWDNLRVGLLAGERLHQDIKRLEVTYLDQNRREYELTKHISLRRLDPVALVNLRIKDDQGNCTCEFDLPEWLFDLDTPGHYLRRIKSVSVSIPSVTGPYTSVNCKLTLLKSQVRHDRMATTANYPRSTTDDLRFTDYFGASEAIVTSTGNADSGLFETQLRDERFLPFEGGGVISTWRLELPGEYPQFDYSTISDVVLSIRYTARDGGDSLRDAATAAITKLLKTPPTPPTTEPLRFPVVYSCRTDFSTEWARARANTNTELEIPITRSLLPYWLNAARINEIELEVLRVGSVRLIDDMQGPVTIPDVDSDKWPINRNDEKFVNLGGIDSTVSDVIVVLWVGKA